MPAVACIGPAGDNLVRFAAISHPPENASGHSGFRAVMGAKRLKVVAVKGGGGVKIADPEEFVKVCKYAMRMAFTGTVDAMLKTDYRHPIPSSRPVCSQSCSVNCGIGRIWDPEPLPFWLVSALMYATESRDPTICTHASFLQLAELYLDDKEIFLRKLRPVAVRLWGSEKVFEPSLEDKIGLTIWCQHRHVMLDCLPLCDFTFPPSA